MAENHSVNGLLPETRTASDNAFAAAEAAGIHIPELKGKYLTGGKAKKTRDKGGGNSGQCGRKWRRKQRGYAGGQVSHEEKLRRQEESALSRANQKPKVVR